MTNPAVQRSLAARFSSIRAPSGVITTVEDGSGSTRRFSPSTFRSSAATRRLVHYPSESVRTGHLGLHSWQSCTSSSGPLTRTLVHPFCPARTKRRAGLRRTGLQIVFASKCPRSCRGAARWGNSWTLLTSPTDVHLRRRRHRRR